uniref:Uncharacterized protein n=1 Tax=Cajanus cajan TaxID=3821 RepID=A0A151RNW6_CAJCA|nr:hypothetical protein KK1_034303 [Cajanus cajan]
MSLSAGLTSSSQNLAYSKVSPADFENSTTATSGATSNTSAVTASLPFRPSAVPCSMILKSFTSATLKLSPRAAVTILATMAAAEHLEVKTAAVFFLLSNSPESADNEEKPLRNHGTRVIAEIVVLLDGSATRIFEINLLESGENHGGNSNSARRTLLYMVIRFSCWKGRNPARRTYKTTPHDQISAFDPSYPFFLSTSGAT